MLAASTVDLTNAERRLDRLVDDLIDLTAEGDATRPRLLQRGWDLDFLEDNISAATTRANNRFVRQIDVKPVRSLADVEQDMSDVINTLLPPRQILVSELLARNFSKQHIDLLMPKAAARAALAFAHGTTGMVAR